MGGVGPGSVRLDASATEGFVYPDDPVVRLCRNTVVMREVRAMKDDDVNSAVEVYYQLGRECTSAPSLPPVAPSPSSCR